MVIVNYRVTLSWTGGEPAWLRDFMEKFTSRAAPLFVLIAGVGTTLLFRSGMRRKSAGERTPATAQLGRMALLGAVLGLLALVVDYNRWTYVEKSGTASPATIINGWIAGDTKITEDLPERVGTYVTRLSQGDADSTLLTWMLGGVAACMLVGLLLRNDPRGVLVTRAGFLLAFGYAWYPVWIGDILHWYGLFLLVGALLVGTWWWVIGAAVAASLVVRPYLRVVEGWNDVVGFGSGTGPFWELEGQARNFFYNGWHPVSPWLGLFLVGMLVGRLRADRTRTAILIGLAGLALWLGAEYGGDAIRRHYADEARSLAADACKRTGVDVPDTLRIVLGPPSDRDAEDEIERAARDFTTGPRSRNTASIEVDVAEGLEAGSGIFGDARRIGRGLGRARSAVAYSDWRFIIEPGSEPGGDPNLVLDVSYGENAPVPRDHERHRAHLVSVIADLMRREKASPMNLWRGLARWPKRISRVGIRRSLTFEDPDTAARETRPYDTTWVDTATMRGIDQRLTRLAGELDAESVGIPWFVSALGTSLMVLGVCLLVARWAMVDRVLHPVVCTGQMAFTLYVFHVFIGLTLIEALGFKSDIRGNLPAVATCIVTCWLISLGFAAWWRSFAKRGPIEALMRGVCR